MATRKKSPSSRSTSPRAVRATARRDLGDAEPLSVESLEAATRSHADAERATWDANYHKTPLATWGVTSPKVKQVVRKHKAAFNALEPAAMRALLDELWRRDVWDLRMIALRLMPLLEKAGLAKTDWAHAMRWAGSATGWAELDTLAGGLVGPLLCEFPDALYPKLAKLADHGNFWLRRLSVIGHLTPFRRGLGRWDVLEPVILELAPETEFFIRKAIGWQLREISHRQPDIVVGFCERHGSALAGLSFREATRRLPAADQDRLKALRARAE